MSISAQIGDVVTFKGTFLNAGTVFDPSTVKAIVKTPSGEAAYTYGAGDERVTRVSEGVYEIDVPCEVKGKIYCKFQGYGAQGNPLVSTPAAYVQLYGSVFAKPTP